MRPGSPESSPLEVSERRDPLGQPFGTPRPPDGEAHRRALCLLRHARRSPPDRRRGAAGAPSRRAVGRLVPRRQAPRDRARRRRPQPPGVAGRHRPLRDGGLDRASAVLARAETRSHFWITGRASGTWAASSWWTSRKGDEAFRGMEQRPGAGLAARWEGNLVHGNEGRRQSLAPRRRPVRESAARLSPGGSLRLEDISPRETCSSSRRRPVSDRRPRAGARERAGSLVARFSALRDLSGDGRKIVFDESGRSGRRGGHRLPEGHRRLRARAAGPWIRDGSFARWTVGALEQSDQTPDREPPAGRRGGASPPRRGAVSIVWAAWLPDGKGILLSGGESGRGVRLYTLGARRGHAAPGQPRRRSAHPLHEPDLARRQARPGDRPRPHRLPLSPGRRRAAPHSRPRAGRGPMRLGRRRPESLRLSSRRAARTHLAPRRRDRRAPGAHGAHAGRSHRHHLHPRRRTSRATPAPTRTAIRGRCRRCTW